MMVSNYAGLFSRVGTHKNPGSAGKK